MNIDTVSSNSVGDTPAEGPTGALNVGGMEPNHAQINAPIERCRQLAQPEEASISMSATAAEGCSFRIINGKRRIVWQSRHYPGKTLTFTHSRDGVNRDYYVCNPCGRLSSKYSNCGIKRRNLKLENGRFLNDPDLVGTNEGHLCMQPKLVQQLEQTLSLVVGVRNTATDSSKVLTLAEILEVQADASRLGLQSNAGTVVKPNRKRSAASLTRQSTQTNDRHGDESSGDSARYLRDPRLPEDQQLANLAPIRHTPESGDDSQPQQSALVSMQVPDTQSELGPFYGPVIIKSKGHVGYRSRLYDNGDIDFSRSSKKDGKKQWFPCTACYGLKAICQARIPGCVSAKLFCAVVRDGQFVERDPDVCGLNLQFANGTSRCVHVCLDAELQRLIGGPAEPPRKQMRLSSFFDKPSSTPSGPSHAGNAQAASTIETSHAKDSSVHAPPSVNGGEPKPHTFGSQFSADAMDENQYSTPAPQSTVDISQYNGAATAAAHSCREVTEVAQPPETTAEANKSSGRNEIVTRVVEFVGPRLPGGRHGSYQIGTLSDPVTDEHAGRFPNSLTSSEGRRESSHGFEQWADRTRDFGQALQKPGLSGTFLYKSEKFKERCTNLEALGWSNISIRYAVVVDGRFKERNPDHCGVTVNRASGGPPQYFHLCRNRAIQQRIEALQEPTMKRQRRSKVSASRRSNTIRAGLSTPVGHDERGALNTSHPSSAVSDGQCEAQGGTPSAPESQLSSVEIGDVARIHPNQDVDASRQLLASSHAGDDDIQTVFVKKEHETNSNGKKTQTFDDFVVVNGLVKDFARFRLKNQDKYPRIDELREAFLEERGLLMQFVSF